MSDSHGLEILHYPKVVCHARIQKEHCAAQISIKLSPSNSTFHIMQNEMAQRKDRFLDCATSGHMPKTLKTR